MLPAELMGFNEKKFKRLYWGKFMNLSEIKDKPISELVDIASELGLEDLGRLKKQEIKALKYEKDRVKKLLELMEK